MNKQKANLPLIEILIGSLILHLVAGLMLGGLIIYTDHFERQEDFVPPPEVESVPPQQLEYKVKMKQQQKQSARPRQPSITTPQLSEMSIPKIEINLPAVDSRIAVGSGMTGDSGVGDGIQGGSSPGYGKVVVPWFGDEGSGECIAFVVAASNYMLTDDKGGYPAYALIKDEVARLAGKLPPGILFNAILYSGSRVETYSETLTAVKAGTAEAIRNWLAPVNQSAAAAGQINNNYNVYNRDIQPMTDRAYSWIKALQAAMEQGADAIFMLVSEWEWHSRQFTEEEKIAWLKEEHDWGEKEEQRWQEHVKEAEAWLAKENGKRRDNGQPERVVVWIGDITQELFGYQKPDPHFTVDDIEAHLENAIDSYYTDEGKVPPQIYIVIYAGKGQVEKLDRKGGAADRFDRIRKLGRKGSIRILEGFDALQNVTAEVAEVER